MQTELLNLLAAREGHFRFESGYHSNLWIDLDVLFLHSSAVHRFAIELADRLAQYKLEAICGPLVGGALIAQTIAARLDIEFYYTERFVPAQRDALYPIEYRLPRGLRKPIFGKAVAIVDDVISAGSAVRGTLTDVRSCGATCVAAGALLVLGYLAQGYFADQNIPLERLGDQPHNLWLPSECPLCAALIPLEDIVYNPVAR